MSITSEAWYPSGVQQILACGTNSYIGLVDDLTVLKYPNLSPNKPSGLDDEAAKDYDFLMKHEKDGIIIEEQILKVLGLHPRIIGYKGKHEAGILLDYMPHGSVSSYLVNVEVPIPQRLKWALQATEAVHYIHSKNVLHCNIHAGNMLLDEHLNIKLCDFQGKLLGTDEAVQLDGLSCEGSKYTMPHSDLHDSSRQRDIFALGSTIYFFMKGHDPFPDLDDEQEIAEKFRSRQLPVLDEHLGRAVVWRCWTGYYPSTEEIMYDLKNLASLGC